MTSTNDGKDVKTNQTSGQKGKTYYIELYKSLEGRLSGECSSEERTRLVCEAWRRVHSLCLHSAPSTHPHLLAWLQRHTSRTILQTEWQSPKSKEQHSWLEDAINAAISECHEAASKRNGVSQPWETQLRHRARWFLTVLPNPWGHHVLKALLDSQGPQPSDKEVLAWLKEERGIMFVTRLRQLAASKCDDLALLLTTAVMGRVRHTARVVADVDQAEEPKDKPDVNEPTFQDILRKEAGFNQEVWDLLMDIEFVLLYKGQSRARCIELAKLTPLRNGYQLVVRLQNRLENSPQDKKLWKNAKDVATLIAQVVIARCMVLPRCTGVAREALYGCVYSLVQLLPADKLPTAAAALAAPAATSRHLHTLAAAVHAQCKEERKPFVCSLYVRAITAGMNELEKLKLDSEKESEARSIEKILASWFVQTGTLLSASVRLSYECILTAFSVHPSPKMYDLVKEAPMMTPLITPDIHEKDPETNSEFGSWANDSRTHSNLVKTSETLKLKHTQKQGNVLSTTIFAEGEGLGLEADLCQDLAVVLSGPRVKTLYWDLDREVLLENCRAYMERTHGGTRALITELKYLNLDPNTFMHLPEEEDEDESNIYYGIEKGYEHLVEFEEPEPEKILYNEFLIDYTDSTESASSVDIPFIMPKRKKKKSKRPPSVEVDPLSLASDTLSEKNERSHSKERSKHKKDKSKKDDSTKEDDENTKSGDINKEVQKKEKKKEKKERKKKDKITLADIKLQEKKSSNLSRLVGMKIAKPNSDRRRNASTNVNNACITDSDYDSQGKSSINSECNDNVLMDRLYSIDDKTNITLTDNSQRTSFPLFSFAPDTGSSAQEDVKRGIQKLIEYRRHIALNENSISRDSPENQNPNNNGNSQTLPGNIHSPAISSKGVNVPDSTTTSANIQGNHIGTNTDFPNKKKSLNVCQQKAKGTQGSSIRTVKKSHPNILNSKNPLPVVRQTVNKLADTPSQRQFQEFLLRRKWNPIQDQINSAQLIGESVGQIQFQEFIKKQYLRESETPAQPSHPQASELHDQPTPNTYQAKDYPKQTDQITKNISPGQKQFHDFLKELQMSINAGTTNDMHDSKSSLMNDKPAIKKIIQPKKVDNAANTYSRLSYMHKNKQCDNKTKSANNQITHNKPLVNVTPEQIQHLNDIDIKKVSHLQSTGQIILTKVDKPRNKCSNGNSKVLVQTIENISGFNSPLNNPVISNILSSNRGNNTQNYTEPQKNELSVIKQCNKQSISSCSVTSNSSLDISVSSNMSSDKLQDTKKYIESVKNEIKVTKQGNKPTSNLSEKDQLDLLLLLRQQNNLRPPTIQVNRDLPTNNSSLLLNKHTSSAVKTDNQCLSSPQSTVPFHTTSELGKKSCSTSVIKVTNNKALNSGSEPKQNRKGSKQKAKPESDWKSVMDDLLARKTPCSHVGPNAMDIVLKKDSFEKRSSHNFNNPHNGSATASSINSNISANNDNIVKQPTLKTNANVSTSNESVYNLKPALLLTDMEQKEFTIIQSTNKLPSSSFGTKKEPLPDNVKHLPCIIRDSTDPFISGIPNSDYDLLEELMDDDLRQEIGELSSDDESYRSPNLSTAKNNLQVKDSNSLMDKATAININAAGNTYNYKFIPGSTSVKKTSNTNDSDIKKGFPAKNNSLPICKVHKNPAPTNDASSKPRILSNELITNPTVLKKTLEGKCQNVSSTKLSAPGKNNCQFKQSPVTIKRKTKILKSDKISANICNNSDLDIRKAHKTNIAKASQVVLDPAQVVLTVPQRNTAQNLMLIGTDLIYDRFSTVHVNQSTYSSNVSESSSNTYVAINQVPMNVALLQTTTIVAPVLSPVIIERSISSPVIQNMPLTNSLNSTLSNCELRQKSPTCKEMHFSPICKDDQHINKLIIEPIETKAITNKNNLGPSRLKAADDGSREFYVTKPKHILRNEGKTESIQSKIQVHTNCSVNNEYTDAPTLKATVVLPGSGLPAPDLNNSNQPKIKGHTYCSAKNEYMEASITKPTVVLPGTESAAPDLNNSNQPKLKGHSNCSVKKEASTVKPIVVLPGTESAAPKLNDSNQPEIKGYTNISAKKVRNLEASTIKPTVVLPGSGSAAPDLNNLNQPKMKGQTYCSAKKGYMEASTIKPPVVLPGSGSAAPYLNNSNQPKLKGHTDCSAKKEYMEASTTKGTVELPGSGSAATDIENSIQPKLEHTNCSPNKDSTEASTLKAAVVLSVSGFVATGIDKSIQPKLLGPPNCSTNEEYIGTSTVKATANQPGRGSAAPDLDNSILPKIVGHANTSADEYMEVSTLRAVRVLPRSGSPALNLGKSTPIPVSNRDQSESVPMKLKSDKQDIRVEFPESHHLKSNIKLSHHVAVEKSDRNVSEDIRGPINEMTAPDTLLDKKRETDIKVNDKETDISNDQDRMKKKRNSLLLRQQNILNCCNKNPIALPYASIKSFKEENKDQESKLQVDNINLNKVKRISKTKRAFSGKTDLVLRQSIRIAKNNRNNCDSEKSTGLTFPDHESLNFIDDGAKKMDKTVENKFSSNIKKLSDINHSTVVGNEQNIELLKTNPLFNHVKEVQVRKDKNEESCIGTKLTKESNVIMNDKGVLSMTDNTAVNKISCQETDESTSSGKSAGPSSNNIMSNEYYKKDPISEKSKSSFQKLPENFNLTSVSNHHAPLLNEELLEKTKKCTENVAVLDGSENMKSVDLEKQTTPAVINIQNKNKMLENLSKDNLILANKNVLRTNSNDNVTHVRRKNNITLVDKNVMLRENKNASISKNVNSNFKKSDASAKGKITSVVKIVTPHKEQLHPLPSKHSKSATSNRLETSTKLPSVGNKLVPQEKQSLLIASLNKNKTSTNTYDDISVTSQEKQRAPQPITEIIDVEKCNEKLPVQKIPTAAVLAAEILGTRKPGITQEKINRSAIKHAVNMQPEPYINKKVNTYTYKDNLDKDSKLKNDLSNARISIEDLPNAGNGPLKRCLRIKLPNGNTFKATISGKMNVNIDSIFDDPVVKSLLWKNMNNNTKCTLNIKQVSIQNKNEEILKTEVKNIIYPKTSTEETIDLISDDEEEDNPKIFKTEFGNFNIASLDPSIHEKHQKKFAQKSVVVLERCNVLKEVTPELQEDKSVADLNIVSSGNQVSTSQEIITDYIEIDDSSNDSISLLSSVSNTNENKIIISSEKVDELKNLLLKDLGVLDTDEVTQTESPQIVNNKTTEEIINNNIIETKKRNLSNSKNHIIEQIDISKDVQTNESDINIEEDKEVHVETPDESPTLLKIESNSTQFLLKIKKCDDLAEQLLRIQKYKCSVRLTRCDETLQNSGEKNNFCTNKIFIDNSFDGVLNLEDETVIDEITLKRSDSLSILTELNDANLDEILAPMSPSLIGNFEIPSNLTETHLNVFVGSSSKICDADWFMTKSMLSKYDSINNSNPVKMFEVHEDIEDSLTDCSDEDLNFSINKSYEVPSLLKLNVDFLAKNSDVVDNLINRNLTSRNVINSSQLRRKSSPSVEIFGKIEKSEDNLTDCSDDLDVKLSTDKSYQVPSLLKLNVDFLTKNSDVVDNLINRNLTSRNVINSSQLRRKSSPSVEIFGKIEKSEDNLTDCSDDLDVKLSADKSYQVPSLLKLNVDFLTKNSDVVDKLINRDLTSRNVMNSSPLKRKCSPSVETYEKIGKYGDSLTDCSHDLDVNYSINKNRQVPVELNVDFLSNSSDVKDKHINRHLSSRTMNYLPLQRKSAIFEESRKDKNSFTEFNDNLDARQCTTEKSYQVPSLVKLIVNFFANSSDAMNKLMNKDLTLRSELNSSPLKRKSTMIIKARRQNKILKVDNTVEETSKTVPEKYMKIEETAESNLVTKAIKDNSEIRITLNESDVAVNVSDYNNMAHTKSDTSDDSFQVNENKTDTTENDHKKILALSTYTNIEFSANPSELTSDLITRDDKDLQETKSNDNAGINHDVAIDSKDHESSIIDLTNKNTVESIGQEPVSNAIVKSVLPETDNFLQKEITNLSGEIERSSSGAKVNEIKEADNNETTKSSYQNPSTIKAINSATDLLHDHIDEAKIVQSERSENDYRYDAIAWNLQSDAESNDLQIKITNHRAKDSNDTGMIMESFNNDTFITESTETLMDLSHNNDDPVDACEKSEDNDQDNESTIQAESNPPANSKLRQDVTLVYKGHSNLILKGSIYEDPVVGTCYVFPVINKSITPDMNSSKVCDDRTINAIENFKSKAFEDCNELNIPEDVQTIGNLKVILPKFTYSRQRFKNNDVTNTGDKTNRKFLKRKLSVSCCENNHGEKRYRKGKNIDYPKFSVVTMLESGYTKEYKRLMDYWTSVKFSYSRRFHKEYIDVPELLKCWPIKENEVALYDGTDIEDVIFTEDQFENKAPFDPLQQTLAEEISQCEEQPYISSYINETNFNTGFGEGSDRVIQISEDENYISKVSAATLSDVKQSQPFLTSEDYVDSSKNKILCMSHEHQIEILKRSFTYIKLRDKVRAFFKKTAAELNYNWFIENMKSNYKNSYNSVHHKRGFPYDLVNTEFIEPAPVEAIVQVVQVGQLPVSAAAQNPVTCDPRVTQVTDASPQCSIENSPHDDSQSPIKTEYTELTTADLSLPLVQEYDRQMESQESSKMPNSHHEDIPVETEITSIVKTEITVELSPMKEEPIDYNDSDDLQSLVNKHINNVDYTFDSNDNSILEPQSNTDMSFESLENHEPDFSPPQEKQQNGVTEKTDQIAHAMSAAGITTETMVNTRPHSVVNMLPEKNCQQLPAATTASSANSYSKTPISAMTLQQALAQILPPPLNQTNVHENNQTSSSATPQVLHIVQGKNANGNQITLVDSTQNSVINNTNTPMLHIVQNKGANTNSTPNPNSGQHTNSYSGLSLVDAGIQQGSNQLLHIVNAGNQKNNTTGQLLKRVNLLTNLANVQGSNEQKMVQFVCKSADGKSIHLNAPHQRSMVLRLQPIESNIQPTAKTTDSQDNTTTSPSSNNNNLPLNKESTNGQHEIKSRSVYEENYAKFIQNSSNKTVEKSTSLPKFGQAFGKQVYQDGNQKCNEVNGNNSNLSSINTNSENAECQPNDNSVNLDQMGQINSPPLLLRKSPSQPAQTQPSQSNLVQQIKQTIAPMNIQTMHGGVIYTRQIPVNIGGGQTINLITVPSTELIDDQKQKVNQNELESQIIKIVPQNQNTQNAEGTHDDANNHTGASNENAQSAPTQHQPVLTQMRIKLPMLSKTPQMVSGGRVVRPSFFQIQRNVIGGANQHVYQQLVLTAAPPLGQHTIRLPQAQTSRPVTNTNTKTDTTEGQSTSEHQMSSSTLEQLREFDMVLEQVKERSTVQPNSNNTFTKLLTPTTESSESTSVTSTVTESTQQVLYSIGSNQSLNVAYVNRKTVAATPTTSSFVRSPDSSGIIDSPSSSHVQIPHTVTSESTANEASAQPAQPKPAKVGSKSKSRPKSSNPPSSLKINTLPPKPSTQKPLEDEQTTQRILYILAEYKEQVENSPDKDKPAPRRRTNPPTNPGSSKRKKSSSGSRRPGAREMSPVHGEDTCRTIGSEDSSCGTSQGDCNESCLDSHSPQDSPRKVVRKLTFENETPPAAQPPRPQPQRNVIVADGQTITVARGTAGKPATAVLMPANYILPVSMVKGGQQIAIVTNRGPKLLTVSGGEGGATNALLLQRLIGPAGLKPVLTRPGVRHVRLPTAALHNLQAFNLTTVQPPDSTASSAPASTPPELVETRANASPWTDRENQDGKPERGSSPEGSEPWNIPSSADPQEYTYEETVRTDNMDRTVLEAIPDRYSPDMEAQRIFDKMFDVESKKTYIDSHDDSSRCAYDIDDDKVYHQVVHKKDGTSQRHHRLTHVSAAALRHKYAILEHELRLQKSLSEECEDLGVDSPSASELFPEAELLFAASPAHDAPQHSHTPQPTILNQSGIPQPDIDDQIATDELLQQEVPEEQQELDVTTLGLDEGIVTVSEDGMQATIALDQEEFARSHPNTTFHSSEPTDEGEVQPFTIAGLKGRHITSTIFHAGRAPATVLVTAPQTTVISQAVPDHAAQNNVKYANIDQIINSSPTTHGNINMSSVLVRDDGLTKFDNVLTDSRELHLSNTASAIIHSTGNATQVIRRVCYEDDKRDTRFLMDEPDALIAGDYGKIAEDSSRDATLESIAGDDGNSSPERHAELFWESNSASERSESRRPMDFSSDSEKCCKSPSYDETNSTDSSGVGTHMRLDSVIKEARGVERSASADGSSADDTHPPLRTYPAKRMYHAVEGEMERSVSGKTRAGERSPDNLEVRRRASGRGVVKRGCHCCTGSPPRPKKPRQRKPTMDFNN